MLSKSVEAFSRNPENPCSDGRTFTMQRNFTIRIVKFGAVETSAQVCGRLREQQRPLHKVCGRLVAEYSHQWFLQFHNRQALHRLYWSVTVT
jgi:hypothetical protein